MFSIAAFPMIADDEVWVWVTFLFDLDRNKS
jgi:hypothetical protein